MSLTVAMQEAYASTPREHVIYETIELDHPAFATPVRVVTGTDEDMTLPLGGEQGSATFTAMDISVTPPGFSEDGPGQAKLRIDNVSGLLLPYLRDAIQSSQPISITFRAYTTADLTQPGDIISDLELREVTLTATAAEGTLSFREIETQAFPLRTYDLEFYPALQNG
ncbi:DUF1833 family protein [Pseudochelatococcus sp. B33]